MTANYSPERRSQALAAIRRSGILTQVPAVAFETRLVYALGMLVCDDHGRFSKPEIKAAFNDPSAVAAARELLRKAGTTP